MTNLSPPRIICAACRHKDGRIVCGPRHFDHTMWKQIIGVAELDFSAPKPAAVDAWGNADEGFIDQHGRFYTREAAWPIAMENKQINPQELLWQTGKLYSEHLY